MYYNFKIFHNFKGNRQWSKLSASINVKLRIIENFLRHASFSVVNGHLYYFKLLFGVWRDNSAIEFWRSNNFNFVLFLHKFFFFFLKGVEIVFKDSALRSL